MFRLLILNIAGAALTWAALRYGWVENPLEGTNQIYMAVMGAVFSVGMFYVLRGNNNRADRISNHLITLGLLGTVLGLVDAFAGAGGGDIRLRDLGVNTAFQTTVLGIVGHLWIIINLWARRDYR